jgi:hypothetical protein
LLQLLPGLLSQLLTSTSNLILSPDNTLKLLQNAAAAATAIAAAAAAIEAMA